MKKRFLSTSIGLAFLLAACVPSVNPLYTAETIVFRPELVGVWKEKPDSDDSWNFTKAENNSYTVVLQNKESSSTFVGHLVKLGDALFLDLFPEDNVLQKAKIDEMYQMALIPGHLITRVKLGKTLELQMLNPDGVKNLLTTDPKALTHALPDKERCVITASTEELQKFFKKHAETGSLWGDAEVLQKIQL
jgi:hypothetical protein